MSKTKKVIEKRRSRNWTNEETYLFAKVLADDENNFCEHLERLALKKSANNVVFDAIKTIFDGKLAEPEFIEENETKNFHDDDGSVVSYDALDTSLPKLRRKYATIKAEWRKLDDIVKSGSGLSPKKAPSWYSILNPIFTETNEPLELAEGIEDTSFNLHDTTCNRDDEDETDSDLELDDENESIGKDIKSHRPKIKMAEKTVVAPHKKRKIVRSQLQGFSQMAKSIGDMAASQIKKTKMMLEADEKRDAMFLKHKAEEAKRNREHELMLARIYMGIANNQKPSQIVTPQVPQYISYSSASPPPFNNYSFSNTGVADYGQSSYNSPK